MIQERQSFLNLPVYTRQDITIPKPVKTISGTDKICIPCILAPDNQIATPSFLKLTKSIAYEGTNRYTIDEQERSVTLRTEVLGFQLMSQVDGTLIPQLHGIFQNPSGEYRGILVEPITGCPVENLRIPVIPKTQIKNLEGIWEKQRNILYPDSFLQHNLYWGHTNTNPNDRILLIEPALNTGDNNDSKFDYFQKSEVLKLLNELSIEEHSGTNTSHLTI